MKLQEAVKQLVNQFGHEIVYDTRLANLVADYNGYEEFPAMGRVFRGILKAGYGKQLYEESVNNPKDVISIAHKFIQDYTQESNFKEDLISYGFDVLLYGLGLIDNLNEPLVKGFDPISKSGEILDSLDERLSNLQKQYLDSLDKLVTLPKDLLKDAPGFYTTEALTSLYEIEYKILAVQQQLGKTDFDWCKEKRRQKLAEWKEDKVQAVQAQLTTLKSDYLDALQKFTIVTKFLFIQRSGYINEEGEEVLRIIEENIRRAYFHLGATYDDWCEKKKASHLERYEVSDTSFLKQLAYKIILPACVLFCLVFAGVCYLTSLDEIKVFNDCIQKGEQKSANSQYGEAIMIFASAKENYKGSYKTIYRSIADKHINDDITMALGECSNMIKGGELLQAANIIVSLPDTIINKYGRSEQKLAEGKLELEKAIDLLIDTLAQNIVANNGHLDKSAKEEVDELTTVYPYHYWLNIIKDREQ